MSQQINLFNPLFLKKRTYFSAVTMGQSLGLLVVGIGLVYGYIYAQRGELNRSVAEVERTHQVQRERFNRLSAELAPDRIESDLVKELGAIEKDVAQKQQVLSQLNAGVSDTGAGYSGILKSFARQTFNGIWLTGINLDAEGQQLAVKGRATQSSLLPEFIRRLGLEAPLQGRVFERLQLEQRTVPAEVSGRADAVFIEFSLVSPGFKEGAAQHLPQSGSVSGIGWPVWTDYAGNMGWNQAAIKYEGIVLPDYFVSGAASVGSELAVNVVNGAEIVNIRSDMDRQAQVEPYQAGRMRN